MIARSALLKWYEVIGQEPDATPPIEIPPKPDFSVDEAEWTRRFDEWAERARKRADVGEAAT